MSTVPSRRGFLQNTMVAGMASAALGGGLLAAPGTKPATTTTAADAAGPRLKKAVKFGMIKHKGSIEDKFDLIKSLGFQGVEMDSPSNVDKDEAVRARDKTGIEIHGVVDSVHWNIRLSDPDAGVRAKGLAALQEALRDAKVYGASTVLLVPGVVKGEDENYELCWGRSQEETRKALPLAKELGVKIAIEVVWNNFLTTPDQLVKYVDEFQDPAVGAYFDISNMIKYGLPPADWIRALGKRMLKFDFKGYDGKANKWVDIGEGTEDWPEVLKALDEVGYRGWATAEVGGGGEDALRDVAKRMNKVLGLGGGVGKE